MQLSACPAFTAILLIAVLIFFTSKLALDNHIFLEADQRSGDRQTHLIEFTKGASLNFINKVKARQSELLRRNSSVEETAVELLKVNTPSKEDLGCEDLSIRHEVKHVVRPRTHEAPQCRVSFPPRCHISKNEMKYYEETTDCFESPLRNISGLLAKPDGRRYVVFQPDLGGWNNIRMALEVCILFAYVTGRIIVLPPPAILYLLHMNKKWGENKATMRDYIDFDRIMAGSGLEMISMKKFLQEVALPGKLSLPLPGNDTELIKQPLWDYLEKACYTRQWSPGKIFLGFNISFSSNEKKRTRNSNSKNDKPSSSISFGDFHGVSKERLDLISLDRARQLIPYDAAFHSHRAVHFPGHDQNRLLTHWYGFFFFADPAVERMAKRFMRDRVRYLDEIHCAAGRVIDEVMKSVFSTDPRPSSNSNSITNTNTNSNSSFDVDGGTGRYLVELDTDQLHPPFSNSINSITKDSSRSGRNNNRGTGTAHKRYYRFIPANKSYVAYHIRRGDFQQKHTRLEAEVILKLTLPLIPNPHLKVVYISTDERNRTFFQPFTRAFRKVLFLSDFMKSANLEETNQNHLGMIEQVVCANAHTFIGTPLSTFTGFITRMRGYLNRTTLVEAEQQQSSVVVEGGGGGGGGHQGIGFPVHKIVSRDIDVVDQVAVTKTRDTDIDSILSSISSKVVTKQSMSSNSSTTIRAVGIYDRTYYFMNKFTHVLQQKPHLALPFWVREFVEPFEDTGEERDWDRSWYHNSII